MIGIFITLGLIASLYLMKKTYDLQGETKGMLGDQVQPDNSAIFKGRGIQIGGNYPNYPSINNLNNSNLGPGYQPPVYSPYQANFNPNQNIVVGQPVNNYNNNLNVNNNNPYSNNNY